jgi:N-methylhydantoinase B
VLADVREGAVSREAAERDYGVVLDANARSVDETATARRRTQMKAKV